MPTTLPNATAPARRPRRPLFAELASIALVLFYLLLLAWNMAALEANFSLAANANASRSRARS